MSNTPEIFKPKSLGSRTWGDEVLVLYSSGKYIGKVNTTKAGCGGNFQYHQLKDESHYVISGTAIVRYLNENDELKEIEIGPGDALRFPPGVAHQVIAITDMVTFEVSTPHFNDRVDVGEKYGIETLSDALPTTTIDQIETL